MTILGCLRRKFVGASRVLQVQENHAPKEHGICARHESSFVPKRVLIVGKLSRYHFEKLQNTKLTEEELRYRLEARGSNYDAMVTSHRATKAVENQVIRVLNNLKVDYKLVNRSNLTRENFEWADLVLPIGGDGTFLLASNLIFDNKKPILGINSYPGKSEGFLMLPPKYTTNISEIFEKLRAGHYGIVMRTRIRTTLKGSDIWSPPFHIHKKGHIAGDDRPQQEHASNGKPGMMPKERRLPWLALNEVFMGESLSARTSTLLINLDNDKKAYRVKCSGICISTGTGSTSWARSINIVTPQIVKEILQFTDCKREVTDDEIEKICDSFNRNLQFNPEERTLCYSIRDMIIMHVWPVPKGIAPRNHCEKITVRSQCYDATLVLDGGIAVPFAFGTRAILDTHPEDALRTITIRD